GRGGVGGGGGKILRGEPCAGAYLAHLLVSDGRYPKDHGLSARDVRAVVPISAFFWVEKEGVAPDRPKHVWGTDPAVWVDASPAHHLRAGMPPTLIIYADGDEPWRRAADVDMAAAIEAAGSRVVDVVRIANRSHMSIWRKMSEDADPASERVIGFVRSGR